MLELQDIDVGGPEKLLLSASSVSTKSGARRKQKGPSSKSHSRNESVEEKNIPRYLRKTVSSQAKQKVRTEPATTGWYCRSASSK